MWLIHSAKGTTWAKHKYIAIKNGRYIYDTAKKKAKYATTYAKGWINEKRNLEPYYGHHTAYPHSSGFGYEENRKGQRIDLWNMIDGQVGYSTGRTGSRYSLGLTNGRHRVAGKLLPQPQGIPHGNSNQNGSNHTDHSNRKDEYGWNIHGNRIDAFKHVKDWLKEHGDEPIEYLHWRKKK